MDEADMTTERTENEVKHLIAAGRKPAGPTPTGECLYCGERVGDEVRWCCAGCRDAWEREAARLKGGVR